MNIRVLSDLRLNNKSKPPDIKPCDVALIAGNISSDPEQAKTFLQEKFKKSVIIAGNEPSYENSSNGKTINEDIEAYRQTFKNSKRVRFLEDNYMFLNPDWIVIGGNYWSDLNLNGLRLDWIRKGIDKNNIPDYTRIYFRRTPNSTRRLITPCDTYNLHIESDRHLKGVVEKFTDKNIIVLTHTAPSSKSLNGLCLHSEFYCCSDMEKYIRDHTNIKYWIHGQIGKDKHKEYMIGECKVIANPTPDTDIWLTIQ